MSELAPQSSELAELKAAEAVVFRVLGDELDDYLTGLRDRCRECGYAVGHRPGPRYFGGFPPWEESWQEDADGCSQWAPVQIASLEAGACQTCGDPEAGEPLTMACAKRHWAYQGRPCSICAGEIDYAAPHFLEKSADDDGPRVVDPKSLVIGRIVAPKDAKAMGWHRGTINALANAEPRHAGCLRSDRGVKG